MKNQDKVTALIVRFLQRWQSRCGWQREAECGSKGLHREMLTAQTRETS